MTRKMGTGCSVLPLPLKKRRRRLMTKKRVLMGAQLYFGRTDRQQGSGEEG